jgi:hypothetical protein
LQPAYHGFLFWCGPIELTILHKKNKNPMKKAAGKKEGSLMCKIIISNIEKIILP